MSGLRDAFDRIGEAAELHLPRTHAAGLALAVTDRHDTLGAVVRGFADVASGYPVRPDTRFQIGSISKSFAALCVLQEEAKGTLRLDVSINELLPWLGLSEPFGPITLHHLLTHTSGLMTGVEHGPWGMIDAIRAREQPPTFAPGAAFSYSNLGYKLIGHALERVSGHPVHGLLMERILGPLGMTRSVGAIVEEDRANASVGYEPIDAGRVAHLQSPLAPAAWQPSNTADGSIVSTAPDLCAYARMVLAHGDPLLDAAGFERWIGPHVDTTERGTRYGYGWDVLEDARGRVIRHTGGTVGFTSLLAIRPADGLAVAICQNGGGVKAVLGAYALDAIAAAIGGDPLPDVPSIPPPDAVADAGSLAGSYRSPDRAVELEASDGGLVFHAGPLAVRLERSDDDLDIFVAPHPALDRFVLRVIRDADGSVAGLAHGPTWFAREGAPGAIPWRDAPQDPPPHGRAGLYRADAPWLRALHVYERGGRLYLLDPSAAEESALIPVPEGCFALDDPARPIRVRFLDEVDGFAQTLEYNGAKLTRSFET